MKKKLLVGMAFLTLMMTGCSRENSTDVATSRLVVMNVLDADYFDDAHIKGSVHVPFGQVEQVAASLDRSVPIVVYCSNYACTASMSAAQQLKNMGFGTVYAYEGGMAEWYQLGYPIVGQGAKSYLKERVDPQGQASELAITAPALKELMKKEGLL